jgi:hypothetical protein
VVFCEIFVPTFVIVTVALGTTAPVGSVTVPVMTPCTVCDQTAAPLARIKRATAKTAKVRSLILSPLSKAFSAKPQRTNLDLSFFNEPQSHYHHPEAPKMPGNTVIVGQFNYFSEGKSRINLSFRQEEIYIRRRLVPDKA